MDFFGLNHKLRHCQWKSTLLSREPEPLTVYQPNFQPYPPTLSIAFSPSIWMLSFWKTETLPETAPYVPDWHSGQHRTCYVDWSIMICGWMVAGPDALNSPSSPFSMLLLLSGITFPLFWWNPTHSLSPSWVTFPQASTLLSHFPEPFTLSPSQGYSLHTPIKCTYLQPSQIIKSLKAKATSCLCPQSLSGLLTHVR